MSLSISQADPKQLSTREILDEMSGFAALAAAVVERWAVLLKELASRRVGHPMFHHPVMQFWMSIENHTLSAEAAIQLAGCRDGRMIRAVLPLSLSEQVEVANGLEIPVAVLTEAREVKTEHMPIHRMDIATLIRVFGPDGIRGLSEQERMLRATKEVVRVGRLSVVVDDGVLKVGNMKLLPREVAKAMEMLGWECRWVGGVVKSTAENSS